MIQALAGGMFEEITYFYIDETTKHGFIIDPGASAHHIADYVKSQGWTIEKILLTHGHIDHVASTNEVKDLLGCEVIIHEEGKKYLENPAWNLSGVFGAPKQFSYDTLVKHDEVISLNANPNFSVQVIHVPGHTLDGVAYYSKAEGIAFVGDIIFAGSVGRSDFPGGSSVNLINGIRERIFTLPDETVLYPGHGPHTTVAYERETNPAFHFYD